MNRTFPRAALRCSFVLFALSVGCATAGSYARARWHDLTDCARLQGAAGLGLYVEAEATAFMQPAAGLLDMNLAPRHALGWDPRANRPAGTLRSAAFPCLLVGWPAFGYGETESGYGDTNPYLRGALAPLFLMGNHHTERRSVSLFRLHELIPNPRFTPAPEDTPLPVTPFADHFWLGGSGTALFVSFDLGLNPVQLVDWVGGFFGLDVLADDRR